MDSSSNVMVIQFACFLGLRLELSTRYNNIMPSCSSRAMSISTLENGNVQKARTVRSQVIATVFSRFQFATVRFITGTLQLELTIGRVVGYSDLR